MKNMLGLSIALSLALVAALLNWKYLERKSQELETISFLAISEGTRIRPGDTFLDNHFAAVEIPKGQVGRLQETAVLFRDRSTVLGMKAVQPYDGGEIVLRQDLKTPQAELTLKEDERVMWIPVDTSNFEPSLVQPGDLVSFIVAKGFDSKSPVKDENAIEPEIDQNISLQDGVPPPPDASLLTPINNRNEIVGPFKILSLGKRLGNDSVFRASGAGSSRENLLGISVKVANEELEPRAQKLFDRLQATNFRQVGVLLHPRAK